ncbi:hypothetical protein [Sulfobacillus harzensis]|uniref:Uncharacterized protein n=1 Tax=Sulfobacillus harzensis TaxID=2729629 RepID=A0A7Y0L739_9FIRM|nr:hypothetical protein [Sulfobacillus harzensis]NMP23966.1 hypothetical protein [Sulfobacillus harzensis]
MSLKGIAMTVGVLVLAGLAGQSSLLAARLWGLNRALHENLVATESLVQVQRQMAAKNDALKEMLSLTKGLKGSLNSLNARADGIHQDVAALEQINGATNQQEANIVLTSAKSGTASQAVNRQVETLTQSSAVLLRTLKALQSLSQEEVNAMRQVLSNATTIEAKTP